MRIFAGKRIGPVFVGGSLGPFHPSRVFLSQDREGYHAHTWFAVFGFAVLVATVWLCLHMQ